MPALGALAMLFVVSFAFSGPALAGRREFGVVAIFCTLWCGFASAEYFSLDFELRRFFGSALYLGAAGVPVAWLVFACRYTALDKWINRGSLCALYLVPALTLLLVATNAYHGLVWSSVDMTLTPMPDLVLEHGWWFRRVHAPYSYLMFIAGIAVLGSRFFSDLTFYRSQVLGVVVSAILATLSNVGYVLADLDLFGMDPTPLALSLFLLGVTASFYRGFLGSTPLSYRQVFVAAQEGLIMVDGQDSIIDINPAGAALSRDDNPIGKPLRREFPWLFGDGDSSRPLVSAWHLEKHYSIRSVDLLTSGGSIVGRALLLQDTTAEHHERAVLEELARVDSLTGTLNRAAFVNAVDARLRRRPVEWPLAVLFIDLDRFKAVNDRYGHSVGDAVLRQSAKRIEQRLRPGDVIGRLGGDEFVVLLDRASPELTEALAERISGCFDRQFVTEEATCSLGASVGFATWPEDGTDAAQLLTTADMRMYEIKHGRPGRAVRRL